MTGKPHYFKRKKMRANVLSCIFGCIASLALVFLGVWQLSFNVESVFLSGLGVVLFSLFLGYLLKVTSISGIEVDATTVTLYRARKEEIRIDRVSNLVSVHTPKEGEGASSVLVYEKSGETFRLVSNWFEREKELISMLVLR